MAACELAHDRTDKLRPYPNSKHDDSLSMCTQLHTPRTSWPATMNLLTTAWAGASVRVWLVS